MKKTKTIVFAAIFIIVALVTIVGVFALDERVGVFAIDDEICVAANSGSSGSIKLFIDNSKSSGNSEDWCSPSWQCSNWGECKPDGKQVRTCEDKWDCNSLDNLPALWKECEYLGNEEDEFNEPLVDVNGINDAQIIYLDEPVLNNTNSSTNAITGAVVGGSSGNWIWIIIVAVMISGLYLAYVFGFKKKRNSGYNY